MPEVPHQSFLISLWWRRPGHCFVLRSAVLSRDVNAVLEYDECAELEVCKRTFGGRQGGGHTEMRGYGTEQQETLLYELPDRRLLRANGWCDRKAAQSTQRVGCGGKI